MTFSSHPATTSNKRKKTIGEASRCEKGAGRAWAEPPPGGQLCGGRPAQPPATSGRPPPPCGQRQAAPTGRALGAGPPHSSRPTQTGLRAVRTGTHSGQWEQQSIWKAGCAPAHIGLPRSGVPRRSEPPARRASGSWAPADSPAWLPSALCSPPGEGVGCTLSTSYAPQGSSKGSVWS